MSGKKVASEQKAFIKEKSKTTCVDFKTMFKNTFSEYYNELNKKVDEELQFQESQQKILHEKIADTEKKILAVQNKVIIV